MKNKVLVSIISDQTLPVVQMIKEFPEIQEHIFSRLRTFLSIKH